MICNRIPAIAASLNSVRHIACFHRGSQSFRLLRKGNQFLCWPAGSLTAIFGGMVALPLAIRQSQCGIGTSGTPIFLRGRLSCPVLPLVLLAPVLAIRGFRTARELSFLRGLIAHLC